MAGPDIARITPEDVQRFHGFRPQIEHSEPVHRAPLDAEEHPSVAGHAMREGEGFRRAAGEEGCHPPRRGALPQPGTIGEDDGVILQPGSKAAAVGLANGLR